ncbi:hypothetical protein [Marinagarivorans cellulosilyticus]|uniref:Uncharacterized protein n=1 Tax=Marinagarivorans cellulosilyticus TaxID=2721545 RepID=A0AAN1WJM1_9GAMM|nr:hypothetical protein [Marinagarivorans cellulosilyticus]BCD98856.1 hypothetical protein MARGE09_P3057 [Marinagarivorans cellulosilyticus]
MTFDKDTLLTLANGEPASKKALAYLAATALIGVFFKESEIFLWTKTVSIKAIKKLKRSYHKNFDMPFPVSRRRKLFSAWVMITVLVLLTAILFIQGLSISALGFLSAQNLTLTNMLLIVGIGALMMIFGRHLSVTAHKIAIENSINLFPWRKKVGNNL